MIESLEYFSRRRWLKLMLATGGTLATGSVTGILAQSPTLTETPNMVLGPFYPLVKPSDNDTDLTMIRGHRASAFGQVIHLSGRVLNNRGEPVRNARIEIWQTNSHGRYAHPSDPNTAAPLDRNFQGFAVQTTDHDGYYKIKTVRPGPYPSREGTWMRAPHIHFDVLGRFDRKVTQMYFPNEPLNEQDRLLQVVRGDRNALLAKIAAANSSAGNNELIARWDIVLAPG